MKILVTGGPVHAKLDAVKFVTNRFKGGLMAKLADELRELSCDVTYLCSKDAKQEDDWVKADDSTAGPEWVKVVYHDGFHDYRQRVLEMAPEFDAVVLGAAVANLIPVCYYEKLEPMCQFPDHSVRPILRDWLAQEEHVSLPLTGKFPSHNFKPGDIIKMDWTIAPRVIDEVRAKMKPGAHLFGFKLLSGVPQDELVQAAYGVLLESGATQVFANDTANLQMVYGVGKDRSVRPIVRHGLAKEIVQLTSDQYYRTEAMSDWPDVEESKSAFAALQSAADSTRLVTSPEGLVFGTAAVRCEGGGFYTTARGKHEFDRAVKVVSVDHDEKRTVFTVGGKATLNAPLLDFLFLGAKEIHHICHYHRYEPGLPLEEWAPPGTVRDSVRMGWLNPPRPKGEWSFNVREHGCYLLYDKEGKLL